MPPTQKHCRICRAKIKSWANVCCLRCYMMQDTHDLAESFELEERLQYERERQHNGM